MSDYPSDWNDSTIGDVCHIFDGPHATPEKRGIGFLFLSISSLKQGSLDLAESAYISESNYIAWTKRVAPMHKDIVFSYETRLGEAAMIPSGIKCCLGRRMGLLRIKDDSVADPRFILHYYLGRIFQQVIKDNTVFGTTVDRIPLQKMGEFPISLPPLPEQKKIAEILSGIDKAIEKMQAALRIIRNIIQGLRDQTQNCEGDQIRIGDLISRISTGVSVGGENRPCRASEQGVLKVNCVFKGEFFPNENKVIQGDGRDRAIMSIRKGMLLMSRANTPELVGACGIATDDHENLFLPDKIWNLEISTSAKCSKEWLNNALNSQVVRSRVRGASTGTSDSMRNISQGNFCDVEIFLPPLPVQQRHTDLIDSLYVKKEILSSKLERCLMLKTALAADLLSGRKRVNV